MSTILFSKLLSQNYIELLEDNEYYDITIEVGEDPNVKIFRAHMNILCYRSPYLRRILASNKRNNDNVLAHIKLPNLSPEIFQIILRYIYGGILSLNGQETSDILNTLIAADDDLQMREIDVWEHVLKWGLTQNPTLVSDSKNWSDDDFKTMKNTLQNCLPLIRFYCLSSIEFSQKVRPYKKLLSQQLYEDLLNSYLDPNSISADNILLPRKIRMDKIIDSKIVNLNIVSVISRRIDKIETGYNIKFAHIREFHLSYKFKLLLRGSRDGFTPEKFHELCDGISNTVTFIKINGMEEIVGGYNPLKWKNSGLGKTNDSFIFSFNNKNIIDFVISNVKNTDHALNNSHFNFGPYFGQDIIIYSSKDQFTDYDRIRCKKQCYEKKIRDSEDYFSIEDYEVFQIV
ncbi:uncharacterized protein OCT59_025334 [Rhizophagus irregularis]|uniref:uncharacterized protein n=1 Tax=Rhizophagus irregularis TaxID=588596 RepID=UPI0033192371|nr:hypothetical protein OCT59_025334 [Rhizophagus irregularis]